MINRAITAITFTTALIYVEGANILGVFPIPGVSHWSAYEATFKELRSRGHNVTVITSFPHKTSLTNWTQIDISGSAPSKVSSITFDVVVNSLSNPFLVSSILKHVSNEYCQKVHDKPEVGELFNTKFDAVVIEIFGADCDVGFAWKLNSPLIGIVSSRSLPWSDSRIGNPTNPSYMPSVFGNNNARMKYFERLQNTFDHLLYSLIYYFDNNSGKTEQISKTYFGDIPSVDEIVANTSLLLVNSHHTIETAAPKMPNSIEIGGIHIQESTKLPDNIQKFMDGAENGVILFSLGSFVLGSSMPTEFRNMLLNVFSELPQRVIWKYEDKIDNIPSNIMISDWLPQNDILAHPKIRLFITHGGQHSTIEAVHHGVPVVGIPLFFDQHHNVQSLVDKGTAVMLDWRPLTPEILRDAIRTVGTTDKSYAYNMNQLSSRFKDRPLSAAENAVYWIEYVIRHEGAPQMRNISIDMPWYQYFLVDVIIGSIIILYILYKTIRLFMSHFIDACCYALRRAYYTFNES